jgi:hypothetical protein
MLNCALTLLLLKSTNVYHPSSNTNIISKFFGYILLLIDHHQFARVGVVANIA